MQSPHLSQLACRELKIHTLLALLQHFGLYHTMIIREDRSSSLYLTAALLFYPIDKISLIYHSVAQLLATKVMVTN